MLKYISCYLFFCSFFDIVIIFVILECFVDFVIIGFGGLVVFFFKFGVVSIDFFLLFFG